jgi:hypothetical protein
MMLIANLSYKSILVTDNDSYLNIQTKKPPTYDREGRSGSLERNFPFCDMLKAQLYDLMKLNKPKQKCCMIAQILANGGRTALRLEPYIPIQTTLGLFGQM